MQPVAAPGALGLSPGRRPLERRDLSSAGGSTDRGSRSGLALRPYPGGPPPPVGSPPAFGLPRPAASAWWDPRGRATGRGTTSSVGADRTFRSRRRRSSICSAMLGMSQGSYGLEVLILVMRPTLEQCAAPGVTDPFPPCERPVNTREASVFALLGRRGCGPATGAVGAAAPSAHKRTSRPPSALAPARP